MRLSLYTVAAAAAFNLLSASAHAYDYCPYPLTEIQCQTAKQAAINDTQRKQANDFRRLQNEASRSVYQYHYNQMNGISQQRYVRGWQPSYNGFGGGYGGNPIEDFAKGYALGQRLGDELFGSTPQNNADELVGRVPTNVPGRKYVDIPECTAKLIRKGIRCFEPIR
jgi:hypothetical protein